MFLSNLTAAFLLLGNAFSCGGIRLGCVRDGVVIDGCDVGGMPYTAAETLLRENLLGRLSPLVIHAPSGDLVLSKELAVTENAAYLVRKAKTGQHLSLSYTRQWADMESVLYDLCKKNAKPATDAEFTFSADGFSYTAHTLGLACEYSKLVSDVTAALPLGGEVFLSVREYDPEITEEILRQRTRTLSTFTTFFDNSNLPRVHNITLAASRIAGCVLNPSEEFSFNACVGERTVENGFDTASIILDGEFVPGVGGGVCQASSTLFCAALRAGLSIKESHPHSLPIAYIPPSLDAMVSSFCDLKFSNPYPFPVYLNAKVKKGSVTFTIYGMPDGKKYETESVVLSRITPPEAEIIEGERGVLRNEKEGVMSESYLLVYDNSGNLLSRTRIRRDCYAAIRGKVGSLPEEPPLDEKFLQESEGEQSSSEEPAEESAQEEQPLELP